MIKIICGHLRKPEKICNRYDLLDVVKANGKQTPFLYDFED